MTCYAVSELFTTNIHERSSVLWWYARSVKFAFVDYSHNVKRQQKVYTNKSYLSLFEINETCTHLSYLKKRGNMIRLFTLQSSQQGPAAHSASITSLQVIPSQQGSFMHSSMVPQSHSSSSSTIPFPHVRKYSFCNVKFIR